MTIKLLLTAGLVFLVGRTAATEVFTDDTLSPALVPQQTRNSIGDEANEVEHLVETLKNLIEEEDRAAEPEGGASEDGLDADPPVDVMEELEKEKEREIDDPINDLNEEEEREMPEELRGETSMGGVTCDWKLVFKVQAKAGADSYPVWSSGFTSSNLPEDPRLAPIGHYKSRDVGIWESLNIKKVKLSLYTFSPNMEIRDLVFNGMGSNKDNWFTKSRLISSPWADLKTAPTNYFSIAGHAGQASSSKRHYRRFFINRNYGGCSADRGWLVVLDGNSNHCLWERRNSGNPRILFSKLPTDVNFEQDQANVGTADVMAIFIKTCDD
ncbi:uncharacterized protein [Branchiostoma lanceolatum]|uniref:Hypp3266 protein n=1 Tax=Branchiostoma lanceolatum TaxID=7740 RepID=A0A8K0A1R5_BRALA|nr:Hypp3266 [Branchiostoma lanceolatum]